MVFPSIGRVGLDARPRIARTVLDPSARLGGQVSEDYPVGSLTEPRLRCRLNAECRGRCPPGKTEMPDGPSSRPP